MKPPRKRRVLLPMHIDADAVTTPLHDLGYDAANMFEATAQRPREVVFADDSNTTFIHYVENRDLALRYLSIDSPRAEEIAREIEARVPHYAVEELIPRLENPRDDSDRVMAFYQLALNAPDEPDEHVLSLIRRDLSHPDPRVRGRVIVACFYFGWPVLASLVRPLAASDPDPTTRRDAEIIAKELEMMT